MYQESGDELSGGQLWGYMLSSNSNRDRDVWDDFSGDKLPWDELT